jgi:biopolymer transport protein ExbD
LQAGDDQIACSVDCPRCGGDLEIPDPTAGLAGTHLVADEAAVRFRRRRPEAATEMDMTPMVDVTFLLLIFFMITAAFSLQKSLPMPAPDPERAAGSTNTLQDFEDSPDFVVVRVDEFNTYHVSAAHWDEEREAPSAQDLRARLRDARQGDGQRVPTRLLVVAHGEARHERVVTAMDAGSEVGMEEVRLVTVEEDVL